MNIVKNLAIIPYQGTPAEFVKRQAESYLKKYFDQLIYQHTFSFFFVERSLKHQQWKRLPSSDLLAHEVWHIIFGQLAAMSEPLELFQIFKNIKGVCKKWNILAIEAKADYMNKRKVSFAGIGIKNKKQARVVIKELNNRLTYLNILNLFDFKNSHIKEICQSYPNLKTLKMTANHLSDKGLSYIATLQHLQSLTLLEGQIYPENYHYPEFWRYEDRDPWTTSGCAHLEKLIKLKKLKLESNWVSMNEHQKSKIISLKKLKKLVITSYQLDMNSMEKSNWDLKNTPFADLSKFPALEYIKLAYCNIDREFLVGSSKNSIKHISLFYCKIENNGLDNLQSIQQLSALELNHCKLDYDICPSLFPLKNLEWLDLTFSKKLNYNSLSQMVTKLPKLFSIQLHKTNITVEEQKILQEMFTKRNN
jgi:hypothetical protein